MNANEPNIVAITHFTSQSAAAQTLNGWGHEILQQTNSKKLGAKELTLRLYSRYGMNDPTECVHDPRKVTGGVGSQREDGSRRDRLVFPDTAFVYSGSRTLENETRDRLNLWRAYGDNGKGIAITTIWSKRGLRKDNLDILKIEYVSAEQVKKNKNKNARIQNKIDTAIDANSKEYVKKLHEQRMKLEVGYKVSDYEAEDEVRIVYYAGDRSGESIVSKNLNFSAESGRLRAYITRKVKVGMGQTLTGLNITIGPRIPEYEVSHWKLMADWIVRQLALSGGPETSQSTLPYIG